MASDNVSDTRAGKGAKTQHISWHQHFRRYFLSHFVAFKISFRNLALTPFATIMTMVAIGICLSLPIGLYLFIKNIQTISQGWDQGSAVTLYVEAKSTPQQVDAIVEKIKTYPFVKNISQLSSQEALEEFQTASNLKDVLDLLPENPLPRVINIQLNTTDTAPATLLAMKESLSKLPQVKEAAFDYQWVEKLNIFVSFSKMLANFLYFIIGMGVVLIIGNTIRLALERYRDEIEVLNLVGATIGFIRRPFLYRGALYGGLGGVIAVLIISSLISSLTPYTEQLSALYQNMFSLEKLRFYDTVILLAISAGLGWLGAALAFGQQHRSMTCLRA